MNFVLIAAAIIFLVILFYACLCDRRICLRPFPTALCNISKRAKLQYTRICATCSSNIVSASYPMTIISGPKRKCRRNSLQCSAK